MVLCQGCSVCNFHSGAGNFEFSCVSPWNFTFVIFWKQTLAITFLGTCFPKNHPVFFSIFPLLKAYVRMLSNYISQKNLNTSFFSDPSVSLSLFSFLSPDFSPSQKSLPASNQSTKGMAAATDPSTTGRGQYILSWPHRGCGKLDSLDLTPPQCHL